MFSVSSHHGFTTATKKVIGINSDGQMELTAVSVSVFFFSFCFPPFMCVAALYHRI